MAQLRVQQIARPVRDPVDEPGGRIDVRLDDRRVGQAPEDLLVGDLGPPLGDRVVGVSLVDVGHDLVFPVDLGERLGIADLGETVGVERVVEEELAVPVVEVLHDPEPDLVEMTLAVHPPGRLPRVLHGRQQQADQDPDDRDDDQELDQREARADAAVHGGELQESSCACYDFW